jgi:hypothetical protein
MKCSDLEQEINLTAGGEMTAEARLHLTSCPVCRHRLAELNEICSSLARLLPPAAPSDLRYSVRRAVAAAHHSPNRLPEDLRDWLTYRLMPLGVGAAASIILGLGFVVMMFSGIAKYEGLAARPDNDPLAVMLASGTSGDLRAEISPGDYARARMGLGVESPSVNPHGALVALTKSLFRGEMKDEEVVVVADVFGDGLARIAEVVEPAGDRRAVAKLQDALENSPEYAAFVPSVLDDRPDSVRVVLKLQSVHVSTGADSRRRSRR